MIDHKYKVGDEIIVRDGNANFRYDLPSGTVKGKIISLEDQEGMYVMYDYMVDFGNGIEYYVAESEIVEPSRMIPEKVVFT